MSKGFKKILSLLLVFVMTFGMLPTDILKDAWWN